MTVTAAGLISKMRQLVDGSIDAPTFVESYMSAWRIWRDNQDGCDLVKSALDRAFTVADCYDPSLLSPTRLRLDDQSLRTEIADLLIELS